MRNNLNKQAEGLFTAVAVYDALGLPAENKTEEEIQAELPDVDRQYLRCPSSHPCYDEHFPGKWSDDTQLTIAVAQSIIRSGAIDMLSMAEEHVKTADETQFGWGGASREAAAKLKFHGKSLYKVSGKKDSMGNGVLMKMGPLAMALEYGPKMKKLEKLTLVDEFTRMTHDTAMAVVCSGVHLEMLGNIMNVDPEKLRTDDGRYDFLNIAADSALKYEMDLNVEGGVLSSRLLHLIERFDDLGKNKVLREISNGGICYAPDTLAMVYGLFAADPTIAAAHRAVRIGGDTDSNASMVASMVTLMDGVEVIPAHLRDQVWRKEEVAKTAQAFARTLQGGVKIAGDNK